MALAGKTAAGVASKWATNLSAAASATGPGSVSAGVDAYVAGGGNPMAAAAANPQKWIQGVTNAQAKWVARLTAPNMTGASWQTAMKNKGIGRIGTGAANAATANGKMTEFLGALLPYEQQGLAQLPPRGDLATNINRASSWISYMAKFRQSNPTF